MSLAMTPTKFLLSRIAEDEAAALATSEAHRRIVEMHPHKAEWPTSGGLVSLCGCGERHPCHTLRALALPYADHPDYREEWKP